MNFALVAVLFLFLSLPGIAFRRSYYSSRFSLSYISTNGANEIIWSLIPAYVFHTLGFWFVENHLEYDVKLEHIGYLLSGGNGSKEINSIFQDLNVHLVDILHYNLSMCLLALFAGNLFRWSVRTLSLDIYVRFLRYPNRWHYLFTGEHKMIELGTDGIKQALNKLVKFKFKQAYYAWKIHKTYAFIKIDILCSIGDQNIIYSGKFEDYFLANNGGLDRILIKYPSKKEYSANSRGEFVDVPSDYLVVPYANIQNINISYIQGFFADDTEYMNIDEIEADELNNYFETELSLSLDQ